MPQRDKNLFIFDSLYINQMDNAPSVIEENKWLVFNQPHDKCTTNCTFFSICPMTIYAPHAVCSDLSIEEKKRFFHLFLYGAEGLKNEILSTLYKYSGKIDFQEPRDLQQYLELLLKVNKSMYDGKNITKNQGTFNIVVGDYNKPAPKEPIIILDQYADPEKDDQSLIFSEMATRMVKEASQRKSSGGKIGSREKIEVE
jgi:hypothetical protein